MTLTDAKQNKIEASDKHGLLHNNIKSCRPVKTLDEQNKKNPSHVLLSSTVFADFHLCKQNKSFQTIIHNPYCLSVSNTTRAIINQNYQYFVP